MTHTLHRLGDRENLSDDFVVLMMASKGINKEGSRPKYQEFVRKAVELGAIKIGDSKNGNIISQGNIDNLLENIKDQNIPLHAVFSDSKKLKSMLKWLKEADLGLSVVVSGLVDKVTEMASKEGIKCHAVENSLGIWGKATEKLPSKEILQIHTMCGHQMVTVEMINKAVKDIKAGRKTPEKAADDLYVNCVCGVFNTTRAARLLKELAEEQ